jgi:hypothetical protein
MKRIIVSVLLVIAPSLATASDGWLHARCAWTDQGLACQMENMSDRVTGGCIAATITVRGGHSLFPDKVCTPKIGPRDSVELFIQVTDARYRDKCVAVGFDGCIVSIDVSEDLTFVERTKYFVVGNWRLLSGALIVSFAMVGTWVWQRKMRRLLARK